MADFQIDRRSGKAGLSTGSSMDLMLFFISWLKDNILKTDKAYVPFQKINSRRLSENALLPKLFGISKK